MFCAQMVEVVIYVLRFSMVLKYTVWSLCVCALPLARALLSCASSLRIFALIYSERVHAWGYILYKILSDCSFVYS